MKKETIAAIIVATCIGLFVHFTLKHFGERKRHMAQRVVAAQATNVIVKPGQVWSYKCTLPFHENDAPRLRTVIAVTNRYVQYDCGVIWSCSLELFLTDSTLVNDTSNYEPTVWYTNKIRGLSNSDGYVTPYKMTNVDWDLIDYYRAIRSNNINHNAFMGVKTDTDKLGWSNVYETEWHTNTNEWPLTPFAYVRTNTSYRTWSYMELSNGTFEFTTTDAKLISVAVRSNVSTYTFRRKK